MVLTAERNIEAQIRSASRIEPDRLPRLKLLCEAWAEAGAEALNAFCASPVEIECAAVTSFAYTPAAPELKEAGLALTFTSAKWRETGFVFTEGSLADTAVEALLGGGGPGRGGAGAARPLTKLDRRLLEKLLAAFTEAGNAVFEPIVPLELAVGETFHGQVGPQLEEELEPDARAFVAIDFRLACGASAGTLRVNLPEKAIAPHRRRLSLVPEVQQTVVDEAWMRDMQEGLQLADLEVRALLDERQITLGEVACFAVGQTIVLDTSMESLIVVECEEQRLFRGRMGMSRDAYVVRIEERIDPTEEFIDDILAD